MPVPAAIAKLALDSARSYLDDVNAVTWSDARLFPILQEAHRELSAELIANGIGHIREQAAIITVPALTAGQIPPISMPNLPPNCLIPISLHERFPGESAEHFELMRQSDFIPNIQPCGDLLYWAWMKQDIKLIGATAIKEVQFRFRGALVTPATVNDSLGFSFAELYLGPRIAAIALPSRKDLDGRAAFNLNTVVRYNVNGEQGVPKRKLGYRRTGWNRRFF
jgi:hypothetical protein